MEKGDVARPPFGSERMFGLVFPNSYRLGMASLGFHLVRQLVNASPGWLCERFFMDVDPPVSVESMHAPHEFRLLAFSVSFEPDYLNVLTFLQRAGLALKAEDRRSGLPLVLVGGIAVDINAHAIRPFADVVLHGEAETVLPAVLEVCGECAAPRAAVLERLAVLPGVEITPGAWRACGLPRPAEPPASARAHCPEPWRHACHSRIVTPDTEFGEMCLVELARGCAYRCTFCYVGHNIAPYRTMPAGRVMDWIGGMAAVTRRFGLVASAVGSHPEIDEICASCDELGVEVSFSSLRAEDVTPAMLRTLARSGTRTVTIAPEAGSAGLRRLLGKTPLTPEQMKDVIRQAVQAGVPNVKLYFMMGLPGETEEDIRAMAALVDELRREFVAVSRPQGHIGSLSVDVQTYIPKPNTPLQSMPRPGGAAVARHAELCAGLIGPMNNVRLSLPDECGSRVQTLLSMGGPESADLLLEALAHGGRWKKALRALDRRGHASAFGNPI